MAILGSYINGNTRIQIHTNGTLIRETINPEDDEFVFNYPLSIDMKLTNWCDRQCEFCHEDSGINGLHGDILSSKFINTLKPYMEIACGGGSATSHPQLIEFLELLKSKKVIANMTVSQYHFMHDIELIKRLIDEKLIWGLGVSLKNYDEEFINMISKFPNAVIHVINGIVKLEDLRKLYNKNLKLLILGYKQFRRGEKYYSQTVEDNKSIIYNALPEILCGFNVVSFDNLSINQLNVQRLLTDKEWSKFFMGDEGNCSMYIDLVNQKFAINSTSTNTFDLLDSIEDMFSIVKSQKA